MENLLIALIGSLIVLDTTVVFQFSFSQPLITCSILGWFFGDLQLGILVGFYLQLLWLSSIPIGGAIVPEGNVAAIVTCALVLRYHMDHTYFNIIMVAAVLYGLIISFIGGQLVVVYRKINVRLLNGVLAQLDKDRINVLNLVPFISIFIHYLLMSLLILLSLSVGDKVFPYLARLPAGWDDYFRYPVIGILGVGAGMVLTLYEEKEKNVYMIIGIILGAVIFYLGL